MKGPSPPPDSTRSRRGRMPEGWLVEAEGLVHIYKTAELEVVALQGLDLQLAEGETIAIAGRSGSGKTTLMNILAGAEPPTAGRARVDNYSAGFLRTGAKAVFAEPYGGVGYILDDTLPFLRAYPGRVAILQGGHDAQVTEADARLLAGARPAAKLTLLPTMNHVLKDEP